MKPGDLVALRSSSIHWGETVGDLGLVLELNDRPFTVTKNRGGKPYITFQPNFWRKDPKEYMEGQAALVQWKNERRWYQVSDLEVICAGR